MTTTPVGASQSPTTLPWLGLEFTRATALAQQAGELLAAMPKHPPGPDRLRPATDPLPRLNEMGLSQIDSSRWRAVAPLSPDRFERHLAEEQAAGREFTADGPSPTTWIREPRPPPPRGALSSAPSSPRRMKVSQMGSYLAHRDLDGPGGTPPGRGRVAASQPSRTMVTSVVVAPTATPSRWAT